MCFYLIDLFILYIYIIITVEIVDYIKLIYQVPTSHSKANSVISKIKI